jgi:hypothetical protein
MDGDETDVDCGGGSAPTGSNPACAACADLDACLLAADCASNSCVNSVCLPPSCDDDAHNGDETDVDCGGSCAPCLPGGGCAAQTDCQQKVCVSNICLPASCNDAVKNGTESDIDCGGTCNTNCPPGQMCNVAADCVTALCSPTKLCTCPPSMVVAPAIGGGAYCIDAYEVTKSEYNVFVQANPNLANLPAACAGNIYQPSGGWPFTEGRAPVTYVDWCDAYSYCAYSGKRLCGNVGGGANPPDAFADATQSAWFNACTGQATNEYPYGDNYDSNLCNGAGPVQLKPGPPAPSPPIPTCLGGVTGLYQMSGNVAEWEDSCNPAGECRVRGGSVSLDPAEPIEPTALRCDGDAFRPMLQNTDALVGIRCCL